MSKKGKLYYRKEKVKRVWNLFMRRFNLRIIILFIRVKNTIVAQGHHRQWRLLESRQLHKRVLRIWLGKWFHKCKFRKRDLQYQWLVTRVSHQFLARDKLKTNMYHLKNLNNKFPNNQQSKLFLNLLNKRKLSKCSKNMRCNSKTVSQNKNNTNLTLTNNMRAQ